MFISVYILCSNCEDLVNIYRNNLYISANERKVYFYGAEGN